MISAHALERRFGEKRALAPVSFALEVGGFLLVRGPNGSGKSTLLGLVAGLLTPTRGELDVAASRTEIGYVAHEPLLYRELTAHENLELFGRLYRVPERRERIGMLLERFGLWDARHERVDAYSRGMAQRLALCRALLHGPRLLLLDEPYSSLDAAGASILDEELAALVVSRGETPPNARDGYVPPTVVVAAHDVERLRAFATAEVTLP